jgi:hypothetical protein
LLTSFDMLYLEDKPIPRPDVSFAFEGGQQRGGLLLFLQCCREAIKCGIIIVVPITEPQDHFWPAQTNPPYPPPIPILTNQSTALSGADPRSRLLLFFRNPPPPRGWISCACHSASVAQNKRRATPSASKLPGSLLLKHNRITADGGHQTAKRIVAHFSMHCKSAPHRRTANRRDRTG